MIDMKSNIGFLGLICSYFIKENCDFFTFLIFELERLEFFIIYFISNDAFLEQIHFLTTSRWYKVFDCRIFDT